MRVILHKLQHSPVFNYIQRCLSISRPRRHYAPSSPLTSIHRYACRLSSTCSAENGVVHSPFPDIDIPVLPLTEYVFQNSAKWPDRPALINGDTGETRTYAQVKDIIWRMASGLTRHGFKRHDVMLMLSANSVELIITCHAVVLLGGVITLSDNLSQPEEVLKQLIDSGAKFIYTDESSVTTAMASSMMTGGQVKKIIIDGVSRRMVPLKELITDDGSSFPKHLTFDPMTDLAFLPYFSDQIGLPRGAMLTHNNILSNIHQLRQDYFLHEDDSGTYLGCLPYFQATGVFANMFLGLALGHTSIISSSYHTHSFLNMMERYQASLWFIEPSVLHEIAQSTALTKWSQSARRVLVGGGPVNVHDMEVLQDKLPHAAVGQVYSMSESSAVLTASKLTDKASTMSSAGVLLPNTRARVICVNDEHTCARGEAGEVWVQGPQIPSGFFNKPDDTLSSIESDGWCKTGDVGYFDEEGHLYVVDRLKEVIKYKGHQVSAVELENILRAHPAVLEACVIGIPDTEAGELPRGYVVLQPDFPISAHQLEGFVAKKVSPFKQLRGGVMRIDKLPKTSSGKLSRKALSDMVMNTLSSQRNYRI